MKQICFTGASVFEHPGYLVSLLLLLLLKIPAMSFCYLVTLMQL